jgi:hypothetical protein
MRLRFKIPLAVALPLLIAYGCDDLYARLRHEPFADVQITRYLAIAEHFNKINYEPTSPITERCVYALFPHSGHDPCWYVMSHTTRFIKVG